MQDFISILESLNVNFEIKDNNLSIGGYLDLRNTKITSLPDNLSIGGYLDLEGTEITSLPDNLSIGGYLYLRNTKITSLPDNLSIGGSLDLRNTKITSLPDNLSIGGYLDLRNTKITSLPDNLSIGGYLYLEGTEIKKTKDGKQIRNFDGNAMAILSTKKVGDFTLYHCEYLGMNDLCSDKKRYVAERGGFYSHGKTIKQAIEDCNFKFLQENFDKDSLVEEIKETGFVTVYHYRLITGACKAGCEDFLTANNITMNKMPLEEVKKIIKGQYGSEIFINLFK